MGAREFKLNLQVRLVDQLVYENKTILTNIILTSYKVSRLTIIIKSFIVFMIVCYFIYTANILCYISTKLTFQKTIKIQNSDGFVSYLISTI